MRPSFFFTLICLTQSTIVAAEREVTFTASAGFLPPMQKIIIVAAGTPGPGQKNHQALAETNKYGTAVKLPGEGAFDIWWQPREGQAIRAMASVPCTKSEHKQINLADQIGIINVFGENQPRVRRVIITATDDQGPGVKGHHPIQSAKDFRIDMPVPEGFYAIWIEPDNGAQARKITDRVRVVAGKTEKVD